MELTEEQTLISQAALSGNNIAVNAVAGSGKTTTIIETCKKFRGNVLQLTYNALLKDEVRAKAAIFENIEVHSYHSFAYKYYSKKAINDEGLRAVIMKKKKQPPLYDKKFDMIIIDEAQDMTDLYHMFLMKIIIPDCTSRPDVQLLLFGDSRQAIYGFKGSSDKYLVSPEEHFGRKFLHMTINTSFRISPYISDLIYNLDPSHVKINTVEHKRSCPKVQYLYGKIYDLGELICQYIFEILKYHKPEDIFVIMPSTKKNFICRKVEKKLVANNILCHVTLNDAEVKDRKIIQNKLVFTTYHQTKGCERKFVIMLNFDNSYYTYYGRNESVVNCPNIIYVAMTRAIQGLFVVHTSSMDIFPLFKNYLKGESGNSSSVDAINTVDTFMYISPDDKESLKYMTAIEETEIFDTFRRFSVCDLIKFIKDDIVEKIMELLYDETQLPKYSDYTVDGAINVPVIDIVSTNGSFESVSAIIGIAVPIFWYEKETSIQNSLQKANQYYASRNDITFNLKQLTDFSWMSEEQGRQYFNNFEILGDKLQNIEFETKYERIYKYKDVMFHIAGFTDAESSDCIFEFKCTSALNLSHILQLVCYGFLNSIPDLEIDYLEGIKHKKLCLYNYRNGNVIDLTKIDIAKIFKLILDSHLAV